MGEQAQQSPSAKKSQSTIRLGMWLVFFAFLLIVLVFRTNISEIRFGNDGVSAKMVTTEEANKLSAGDRKAASEELTQRISALESEARSHAAAPQQQPAAQAPPQSAPVSEATYQQPAPAQTASLPNIAGTWGSPIGLTYVVVQYGNYVLISEVNQGVVEAAAGGTINGWSFSLPSQNILDHAGVLKLTVSADQRHMTGQYTDTVTGVTSGFYLNR